MFLRCCWDEGRGGWRVEGGKGGIEDRTERKSNLLDFRC